MNDPKLREVKHKLEQCDEAVMEEYELRDDLLLYHGKVVVPKQEDLR